MITVRMSEAIEADTSVEFAAEAASAAPADTGGKTATRTPPTLSASEGRACSHTLAPARTLNDRHWNLDPSKKFVPENFLVLPDSLRLSEVDNGDWIDPLGPSTTRINATEIDLSTEDPKDPRAPEGFGTLTNWSRFMTQRSVLQMQGAMDEDSRAAGGMAAALLAGKVTDLVVVDALEPDATAAGQAQTSDATLPRKPPLETPSLTRDGAGYPVGLSRANPASRALAFGVSHDFPPGGKYRWIKTDPSEPVKPKAGLSNWAMNVDLRAADGTQHQHQLRTHALNLNAPGWIDQLLWSLNVRWLDTGKQPLALALLCKDGATSSGVVATALHGMECLEAFNLGLIQLKDADDLAQHLDSFIKKSQSLRSPAFAQVGGKAPDTAGMARDIWNAWVRRHGDPRSNAVIAYRNPKPDVATPDEVKPARTTPRRPTSLALIPTTAPKPESRTFEHQISRSSDDSGLCSGSTLKSQRASSVFEFSPESFSVMAEMDETDAASMQRARTDGSDADPLATDVPAAHARTPQAASVPASQTTTPPGAERRAVKQAEKQTLQQARQQARQHGVELPRDGGRPAPRLFPSATMSLAEFRELTQAPPSAPAKLEVSASTTLASRGQSATDRAGARPSLSPVEQALSLFKTREAAGTASAAELVSIPSELRTAWQPGGERFEAFRGQLDGLVSELTSSTGFRGFLRTQWGALSTALQQMVRGGSDDASSRGLEAHMGWAKALAQQVNDDFAAVAHQQAGSSSAPMVEPDQRLVGQLIRDTIKTLLAQRFAALPPAEQLNWRERVSGGRSERFQQALAETRSRVDALPRRLNPSAHLLDDAPLSAATATATAPIFLSRRPGREGDASTSGRGLKSPAQIRDMVDQAWAPRWVVELAREVVGVGG